MSDVVYEMNQLLQDAKKALALDAPIFPWATNPPDKIAAGIAAAAGTAKAGGSPDQQQAARQEALNAYDSASKNFDVNNPMSNIIQRAADALGGTTDAEDVLGIDWSFLSLDQITKDYENLHAFDWKSVAIVGLVIFIVFLILKEVL